MGAWAGLSADEETSLSMGDLAGGEPVGKRVGMCCRWVGKTADWSSDVWVSRQAIRFVFLCHCVQVGGQAGGRLAQYEIEARLARYTSDRIPGQTSDRWTVWERSGL